jgi:hypothetical protein
MVRPDVVSRPGMRYTHSEKKQACKAKWGSCLCVNKYLLEAVSFLAAEGMDACAEVNSGLWGKVLFF